MNCNGNGEIQSSGYDVEVVLRLMSTAIQRGEFEEAEHIGNTQSSIPLAIPQKAMKMGQLLSKGAQASVYVAEFSEHGPVAVKLARIRENSDLIRLRKEVALLAQVSNTHSNIVRLVGARMIPPNYQLVLGLESTNAQHQLYENSWRPGWPGALALGSQLASAIAHVHSHGIIHRDIKPHNVLLSPDCRQCRLTDFGIATKIRAEDSIGVDEEDTVSKPSGGFYRRQVVGTLEYMAPEVLLNRPHSFASDIYALAVVINELASARFPYSDCHRDNPLAYTILEMGYGRQDLTAAVVADNLRPTIPSDAPPAIVRLLKACWSADPNRRPTAEVVASALAALSSSNPWVFADDDEPHDAASTFPQSLVVDTFKGDDAMDNNNGNNENDLSPPVWAHMLLKEVSEMTTVPSPPRMGSFAAPGPRGEDKMEDRCLVVRSLFGLDHCNLFAIFDGHRGEAAAEYLASSLEVHLEAHWHASTSAHHLLTTALVEADEEFRRRYNPSNSNDPLYPGSTAIVGLLIGRQLSVANVGDSRAVLCSNNSTAIDLSSDQSAELRHDERNRVMTCGGEVMYRSVGGWRVGAAGLAVTRSIGDADLKECGVISEPEISTRMIDSTDSFVILASDGVWDLMSSQEVVSIILDTVKQPALCAQRIVIEALARGSRDNASAVVTFLPWSDLLGEGSSLAEKVYDQGRVKYQDTGIAARIAARTLD